MYIRTQLISVIDQDNLFLWTTLHLAHLATLRDVVCHTLLFLLLNALPSPYPPSLSSP